MQNWYADHRLAQAHIEDLIRERAADRLAIEAGRTRDAVPNLQFGQRQNRVRLWLSRWLLRLADRLWQAGTRLRSDRIRPAA